MTSGVGVMLLAGAGFAQPAAAWQEATGGPSDVAAMLSSIAEPQEPPAPPTPAGTAASQQPPPSSPASPTPPPVIADPTIGAAQSALPMPPERAYVPARSRQETVKARYLVQVMERVLESSVKYAATQMNYRLQAVSPDLIQLSGAARAHGFRLEGYGVFFDVEVPAALRQTMGWMYRSMAPNDREIEQALTALRGMSRELDGKQRGDVDTALKLIELRVRPNASPYTPSVTATGRQTATANVSATAVAAGDASANGGPVEPRQQNPPAAQPSADRALAESPDMTYEMEVRDALIGAMLEYGTTLSLGPDEWLTIAARDNQNVIVPGDLSETVTVILRIKGSDLADYKAGRLDETTTRSRVDVREF